MKTAVLCITLMLGVQLACCTSSEELIRTVRTQMLENYMQRQSILSKAESVCPGYRSEFEDALTESEKCWMTAEEETETQCQIFRTHSQECTKPVVKVLETCLPEKSREIPQFVVDVIEKLGNYICKTDGEHLIELFNPCAKNINYRTQRCIRRLTTKYQQAQSQAATKEEVCSTLKSMRGCLESHLNSACGSKITKESFLSVYNVIVDQCDSNSSTENEVDEWKAPKAKEEYEYVAIL